MVFPTHSLISQDKKSNLNWLNEYYPQINLNTNNPPTDLTQYENDGLEFRRGKGHTFSQVWGRGLESKGVYPKELLPTLFSRKIVFDKLDLRDGKLLWVFTGEKAGFTIKISREKVRFLQRVYDSFGYHNISENQQFSFSRLAEKEFLSAEIKYSGKLTSVSISYTHDLKINLYLNEKLVATQMCFFDVTRHQIRYTGKEGVVAGTVLKPKIQVGEIVVNSKKKYQKIIGFGGITSVVAYNELSNKGKTDWWEFIKKYNLLIQREYPNGTKLKEDYSNFDVLEDASVHYYGDNFPNGEISDFKYNKQIMDLGGLVIFEFWALPPWAGKDIKDESGRIRQRPIIKKYTEAMVNYCKISEQKTGRPPQIVGIQNERNQPPGVWQNMTLSLRKALDDNEFKDVKIHMFNSGILNGGIEAAKAFTHKKEV